MDAPEGGASWRPRLLEWGWPTLYGFDAFVGQADQRLAHNMYPKSVTALGPNSVTTQNSALFLPLNAKPKSRSLCMAQPDKYNHTTDVFSQTALEWLHQCRDPTRPFFLYLSFTVPHAGGWGSAPLAPEDGNPVPSDLQYASRMSWPEVERDHAASITHLDARIGEVMAALDSLHLTNRTIVWFASDNGPHNEGGHSVDFFSSSGGLRGYKRSFYEGGVRSPSIVRWPGVTQPGGRVATPWAFWDVYPTMLEMAGLPVAQVASAGAGSHGSPAVPARAARMASMVARGEFGAGLRETGGGGWQGWPGDASLDGRSIVPALRGEEQPSPRYLFWTWREHRGRDASRVPAGDDTGDGADVARRRSNASAEGSGAPIVGYAARMGGWKLVVHRCADQVSRVPSLADADAAELYYLPDDRKEERDVAAKRPRLLRDMLAVLADPQERLSCECFQC
jgi:arylsulfatase A-like enzyme